MTARYNKEIGVSVILSQFNVVCQKVKTTGTDPPVKCIGISIFFIRGFVSIVLTLV